MRYLSSCDTAGSATALLADRLAGACATYNLPGAQNAAAFASGAATPPDCRKLARSALERLGRQPGGQRAVLRACANETRAIAERLAGVAGASAGVAAASCFSAGTPRESLTFQESGASQQALAAEQAAAALAEEATEAQLYDNAYGLLRVMELLLPQKAPQQRGGAATELGGTAAFVTGPAAGGTPPSSAERLAALEEFARIHSGSMRHAAALEQRGWGLLAAHMKRLTAVANVVFGQLWSGSSTAAR